MNAGAASPPKGPPFGIAGEPLACPPFLDLLAAFGRPAMAEGLSRLLSPSGHRLHVAEDEEALLARVRAGEGDVVLLDDAFLSRATSDLPRQVKESVGTRRWVPTLLLAERPPAAARCLETGIDDWLPLPVDQDALASRLTLLSRSLALQRRLLELHRFQTLFDHVLDGIVATNGSGVIESFNPAAERIFGYRAAEVVGRNVSVLMPLPDAHRHDAYMARYRATGEATVMGRGREIFGKRKDGTLVPLFITLTEMEWLGGRHFVAVIQDISERKRQEQRLANSLSELERYRERNEEERRITREIVERMMSRGRPDDPLLSWTVIPAEVFSGDVILAQRSPDGRLYVFAADAMGHGLPAAVSLLPVAGIFHAMAAKGLAPELIAQEMHSRLAELVPRGYFVAACLVVLDEASRTLTLWTAGMPRPVLCFSQGGPVFLGHSRLPLGIRAEREEETPCEEVSWSEPGWLVIYSDGLTEAGHVHTCALGEQAISAAVHEALPDNPFDTILGRLRQHLGDRQPEDDILLAVLRLP